MNLIFQGVDFKNCPSGVGEKLMLDAQQQRLFLYSCRACPQISDALILNTCNRLEFYFYAKKKEFDISAFINNFIFPDCWGKYKQTLYGLDVVRHLFSVAAGIESQIIGENEIFSQLKSAYSFALRCNTVKFMFHRLLHSAFRTAKAVKTHTNISAGALSIAQAAVELAAENTVIEKAKVFVIGSGTNAELVMKHLIRKNAGDIAVVARNPNAARHLISKTAAGQFLPLSDIEDSILDVDIVFAATSSQQPLLTAKSILKKRTKPLLLIDISVPRNIEPELEKIDKVKLFDIDSLNKIIDNNNLKRTNEIPKAQAIIYEHLQTFSRWFVRCNAVSLRRKSLSIIPAVKRLPEKAYR
jgi:glutamyl-tRNA reductase